MKEPVVKEQMQVQDVITLIKAIDVATARGAFRASEMANIGGAYDKVSAAIVAQLKEMEANK